MNIRTLTTVCAGLAVITGTVTATLWRELRIEQEQTAALRSRLAGSARARIAVAPDPRMVAGSAVAAGSAATQAQSNVTAAKSAPPASAVPVVLKSDLIEQELLKDPAFLEARRAALRASIAQTYPGLAEEVGLTSEEADRLFELLAETQMTMTENRQAMLRQQDDALRAMLGDARYKQWEDYQPTRGARMQANSFATTLAEAGAPLDSTQSKSLVAAVLGEQRSAQQDMAALERTINPADPQSLQQGRAALTARQAQINQRILDAAGSQLNAQQLGILRAQFEQQDALNRAAARVRERMQAAGVQR